jgi:hypothetical protein
MNMNTRPFDSSFKVARHIRTNVVSAAGTYFSNFCSSLGVEAIMSRNVSREVMYTIAPVVQGVVYTYMSDFIDNYKYRV